MLGKNLSEALGGIGEEKITAAMKVYEKKRQKRSLWLRVGAAAATLAILLTAALWPRQDGSGEIITAPGVMKVYAYDATGGTHVEDLYSYELSSELAGHRYEWAPDRSNLYGLPLSLGIAEGDLTEPVTLEVEVDHGSYYGNIYSDKYKKNKDDHAASLQDADLGSKFIIENGESIYWSADKIEAEAIRAGLELNAYLNSIGNRIHTDVVIKSGENIVGYTVVRFTYDDGWYYASVVKTVRFPMVDGEYQTITEEYVRRELDACRTLKLVDRGGVYHSGRGVNESAYAKFLSSTHGLRYSCNVTDEAFDGMEVTFDFSVNYGSFWHYDENDKRENLGSAFTIGNDEVLYWTDALMHTLDQVLAEDGGIYAEVIIRADGEAIGCAVIKIKPVENKEIYTAWMCKTVFLEDGESGEDVGRLISEIKKEME